MSKPRRTSVLLKQCVKYSSMSGLACRKSQKNGSGFYGRDLWACGRRSKIQPVLDIHQVLHCILFVAGSFEEIPDYKFAHALRFQPCAVALSGPAFE
eukprot:s523_g12.t1